MRTESNIKPLALSVEKCAGDIAEVIFCENITTEQRDEDTVYTYDEYRTAVPYRSNLLEVVTRTKSEWLTRAIAEELERETYKPTPQEQLQDDLSTVMMAVAEIYEMTAGGANNV